MKGRMVPEAAPIRKLRVVGRSRRNAGFCRSKRPVSGSLHRGLAARSYDFALGIGDELVSYTVKKPRKIATRYYAHSNHLYSVAAITSATGSVIERWSYNAYGVPTIKNSANATIAKSAVGQDRGFTGYKLDSETGLSYARNRMHSSRTGRFINRDQIGYKDGLNLYSSYFTPNYVDPFGLDKRNCKTKSLEVKLFIGTGIAAGELGFEGTYEECECFDCDKPTGKKTVEGRATAFLWVGAGLGLHFTVLGISVGAEIKGPGIRQEFGVYFSKDCDGELSAGGEWANQFLWNGSVQAGALVGAEVNGIHVAPAIRKIPVISKNVLDSLVRIFLSGASCAFFSFSSPSWQSR